MQSLKRGTRTSPTLRRLPDLSPTSGRTGGSIGREKRFPLPGVDRDLVLGRLARPGEVPRRPDERIGGCGAVVSATRDRHAFRELSGQIVLPKDLEPGDWFLVFHRLAGRTETRTGTAYVQVANFRA